MVALTLDPALADVIPLEDYPNIAQDVIAGRFPYPPTLPQVRELERFLPAAAAASSRDSIHVAAYAAYVKGLILAGSSNCTSQSQLHGVNVLLNQASAILLSVLGGNEVELSCEVVNGTEWFLLQVLAEYGHWIKNLPSRPVSVHESKRRAAVKENCGIERQREADAARRALEQKAKEEEVTAVRNEETTKAYLSEDADTNVAEQEALFARYKAQRSTTRSGSNQTTSSIPSGSGAASWKLRSSSSNTNTGANITCNPAKERADSPVKRKEEESVGRAMPKEKCNGKPRNPSVNDSPHTSDDNSDDESDLSPGAATTALPIPVKAGGARREKIPLLLGDGPTADVIAQWQMTHGVPIGELPARYRKVLRRRVVRFIRQAEAFAYNEWMARGDQFDLRDARGALKLFSLKDSGGEYARWSPPTEAAVLNHYREHICRGFSQMFERRKKCEQRSIENDEIGYQGAMPDPNVVPVTKIVAESAVPSAADTKAVAEVEITKEGAVEITKAAPIEAGERVEGEGRPRTAETVTTDDIQGEPLEPLYPLILRPSLPRVPILRITAPPEDTVSTEPFEGIADEAEQLSHDAHASLHPLAAPVNLVERCQDPAALIMPELGAVVEAEEPVVQNPTETMETSDPSSAHEADDLFVPDPSTLSHSPAQSLRLVDSPKESEIDGAEMSVEEMNARNALRAAAAPVWPASSMDWYDLSDEDMDARNAVRAQEMVAAERKKQVADRRQSRPAKFRVGGGPYAQALPDIEGSEDVESDETDGSPSLALSAPHRATQACPDSPSPFRSMTQYSPMRSSTPVFGETFFLADPSPFPSQTPVPTRSEEQPSPPLMPVLLSPSPHRPVAPHFWESPPALLDLSPSSSASPDRSGSPTSPGPSGSRRLLFPAPTSSTSPTGTIGTPMPSSRRDTPIASPPSSSPRASSTSRRPGPKQLHAGSDSSSSSPSASLSLLIDNPFFPRGLQQSNPVKSHRRRHVSLPETTLRRNPVRHRRHSDKYWRHTADSDADVESDSYVDVSSASSPRTADSPTPARPYFEHPRRSVSMTGPATELMSPSLSYSGPLSEGRVPRASSLLSPTSPTPRPKVAVLVASPEESGSTQEPESVPEQETTQEPERSDAMAEVEAPEMPQEREVSQESEATQEPETIAEPERIAEPEKIEEPIVTEESETTDESEVTEPDATQDVEAIGEPELPEPEVGTEATNTDGTEPGPTQEPTPSLESPSSQEPVQTQEPALAAAPFPTAPPAPQNVRDWDVEMSCVPEHLRVDRKWARDETRRMRKARKRFAHNRSAEARTSASDATSGYDSASSAGTSASRCQPRGAVEATADLSTVVEEPLAGSSVVEEPSPAPEVLEEPPTVLPEECMPEEPEAKPERHDLNEAVQSTEQAIVPAHINEPPTELQQELAMEPAVPVERTPSSRLALPEEPISDQWEHKPWVPLGLRTGRRWTDDEIKRVKNQKKKWLKKHGKKATDSDASRTGSVRSIVSWATSSLPGTPSNTTKRERPDEEAPKPSVQPAQDNITPKVSGSLMDQYLATPTERMVPPTPSAEDTPQASSLLSGRRPTPSSRVQNICNMFEQNGTPTPTRSDFKPLPQLPESKPFRGRLQAFTSPPPLKSPTPPPPARPPTPPTPPPPKPRVKRGYEAATKASEKREDGSTARRSDEMSTTSYPSAAARRSLDGRSVTPSSRPVSAASNRPPSASSSRPSSASGRPRSATALPIPASSTTRLTGARAGSVGSGPARAGIVGQGRGAAARGGAARGGPATRGNTGKV